MGEKMSSENNSSWVYMSSIQRSNESGLETLGSDSKLLGMYLDCRYANKTWGIHGNVYIDGQYRTLVESLSKMQRVMSCEQLGWVGLK